MKLRNVHDGAPIELIGKVARHTPEGFAVEFKEGLVPDVRDFVDEAAALANATKGAANQPDSEA